MRLVSKRVMCLVVLIFIQARAQDLVASSDSEKVKPEFEKHLYFPIIYYTPESSFAGGLIDIYNFWKEKEGKYSQMQTIFSYSIKQQSIVRLAPKFYFDEGQKELGGSLFYSYYPNEFYGFTKHLDNPEDYTENNFKSNVYGTYNFYSDFYVRAEVLKEKRKVVKTEPGELRDYLDATKFYEVEIDGLGIGLEWDSRNYPQSPTQGSYYKFTMTHLQTQDKKWKKYELDFKNYRKVFSESIWANQIYIAQLSEKELPLTSYLTIGGNDKMRGYYAGEYRGTHLILLQTEIRNQFNAKYGWSVFAGAAKLSDEFKRIGSKKTRVSVGAGLNYMMDPASRTKLKLDFGISEDNNGFYFVLGESF